MTASILIPCHNEELTIKRSIQSCLNQSHKPSEIVVVNDGSTDHSLKILSYFKNKIKIVNIPVATGNKSYAQEAGLKHITSDILITTDADTILDRDFVKNILKEFQNKKVIASAGYVKSIKQNWLTACRQIDYLISQEINKSAQALINAIFVIPGCAAAYRTKHFKKYIFFGHDTLTEDLDFTYKYHRNKLKITFCKSAIAYTCDPTTIPDYIGQLRRWNSGNWQNLLKHYQVIENPGNALEMALIYLEGLTFPLVLTLALILNLKLFLLFSLTYLTVIFIFAIYGARRDNRWDLVLNVPVYYFVSFINYAVFIEQFILEVILTRRNLVWFQPKRKAAYIWSR